MYVAAKTSQSALSQQPLPGHTSVTVEQGPTEKKYESSSRSDTVTVF